MDYAKRLQVVEWLNTLGYDIEIDKDGLWMEEYIWQEHKTKDVIDIIIDWNEKNLKPNELRAVNRNEQAKEVCEHHHVQFIGPLNKWICLTCESLFEKL